MASGAGWYADPWAEHGARWWDGERWTGWVDGRATDPTAPSGSADDGQGSAHRSSTEPDDTHDHDRTHGAADPDRSHGASDPDLTASGRAEVAAFLGREVARGAIASGTYQTLMADLATWEPDGVAAVVPPPTTSAPAPWAIPSTEPATAADPEGPDPWPVPSPVVEQIAPGTPASSPPSITLPPPPPRCPPPAPASAPSAPFAPPSSPPSLPPLPAPPPPPPRQPRPRRRPSRISAELAVHGLAYAGVALVFTGVIGFVAFAFGDVGTGYRPLAELAVALMVFGAGAFLRRRGAPFAGDAMILLGGLVLPVLVAAAFADSAPFPPDLRGNGLAASLSVSYLALAGVYALLARSRADHPLRFLVSPMVWWAVAAGGLAFAAGDPDGRDLASPLAAQWALAAVAVTLTLALAIWRPNHPLARPTRAAGFVGAPLALLLTLVGGANDNWPLLPMVLAGAATVISVDLLLAHRPAVATRLQAAVVVVVGVACVPPTGEGWSAAGVAVVLLALVEKDQRRRPDGFNTGLILAGTALASLGALVEPGSALAAGVVGLAWCGWRTAVPLRSVTRALPAIGLFVSPLIALAGLAELASLDVALMGLAGVLLAGVAATRATTRATTISLDLDDGLAPAWVSTMTAVVIAAALLDRGGSDGGHALAVALAAGAVAAAPFRPVGRVWTAGTAAIVAGAFLAASAQLTLTHATLIGSGVALALIAAGQIRRVAVGGHVAAFGHAGAMVTLAVGLADTACEGSLRAHWSAATVTLLIGVTVGWALSTAVGEAVGSPSRDLWIRLAAGRAGGPTRWDPDDEPAGGQGGAAIPAFLALLAGAAVIPAASVAAGRLERTSLWLAPLALVVPVLAAAATRATAGRRPVLARTWASGVWLGVVAILLAVESWWPLAATAAAVVAMVVGTDPHVRSRAATWFGWAATGVGVAAVGGGASLVDNSVGLAVFGWASMLLVGSLGLDEALAGVRRAGETVRRPALEPPFLLGAVMTPVGLLAATDQSPTANGWLSLAVAVVAFAAATFLRKAWLSLAGWGASAVAGVLLLPWEPIDVPWTLVALAAGFVLAAEGMSRLVPPRLNLAGSGGDHPVAPLAHPDLSARPDLRDLPDPPNVADRGNEADWADRWNLPPLAVAGVLVAGALVDSLDKGWVPATWLGAAALTAVVGARLRSVPALAGAAALALVGAGAAGPGWLALAFGLSTVAAVVAAERGPDLDGSTRNGFQILTAVTAACTWASVSWWQAWDAETLSISTAVVSGAAVILLAIGVRWLRLAQDWLAATMAVPLAGEATALALLLQPEVPASPARLVVAASLAVAATAAGMLARPVRLPWLRELALSGIAAAALLLASGLATSAPVVVAAAVASSVAAVLVAGVLHEQAEAGPWVRPALVLGGLAMAVAVGVAVGELPNRPMLVAALIAAGVELLGLGLVGRRAEWLMAAPFAFLAAWVTYASEGLTGDPQWFTLPLGLTVLVVLGIVRTDRRRVGADPAAPAIVASDLLGMLLVVGPALVETVTRAPAYGFLAVGSGMALVVFGALTEVRRRLVVGAATVLVTLVLMVVSPLVDLLPGGKADAASLEGWLPWALLAAIGMLALLAAAFLEQGRRLVRRGITALSELTTGWE